MRCVHAYIHKLMLTESIFCRLELDEPQRGYIVRSEREGWLQGFITITTFSTRHRRCGPAIGHTLEFASARNQRLAFPGNVFTI